MVSEGSPANTGLQKHIQTPIHRIMSVIDTKIVAHTSAVTRLLRHPKRIPEYALTASISHPKSATIDTQLPYIRGSYGSTTMPS